VLDNHTNNDDGPIDDISNETLSGWTKRDSASKTDLSALGINLEPDDPLLDSMVRFEK
jgi:hypothetical protein|tara:strand:+ start:1604 stop:1777 length:174 start_codon:yes stop_codon:yes gene_type:complete